MYLAKAVSTWDNLTYLSYITGLNAEQVNKWDKATVSSSLQISNIPTCCFPSLRQSSTTEAQWILSDLRMTKQVVERPLSAEMEEVLDVKRISKSFDMKIENRDLYKLIGTEKDGQPNLSPTNVENKAGENKAKFLNFQLICLSEVETKLSIPHEGFPLARSMEQIVNYREAFYSKRVGSAGPINIKQKVPRLNISIRDTFSLHGFPNPATSTPNSSNAELFNFNSEGDHSYASNNETDDFNLNEDEPISESQLYLTASALPEIEEDEEKAEGEDKEGEIA